MQEKVLILRQELSQYLLFHTKNRKNPTLEPEPVIEETDDEDDDKEECMLIPNPDAAKSNTATMPNPDAPNPDAAKSPNPDAPATMPNPDALNPDAAKSDAPATMPDPDAPNLDAAKSNTATKDSTEGSTEGTSDSSTEGSQQDSTVDENTGGIAGDQSTADSEIAKSNTASSGSSIGGSQQDPPVDASTEGIADDQSTAHSEIPIKSPTVIAGKRKRITKDAPVLAERIPLPVEGCLEVYKLIETKFNADVVLTVGETKMTGGELSEFSANGQHALSIINAFVHCVKSDDKAGGTKGYHTQRIIVTPEDMKDAEALVLAIEQELNANKMSQRIISCPLTHDGEWIVLVVDVKTIDEVTIVHPSDSKLPSDMYSLARTFGKHVRQAFFKCSRTRPISGNKTIQVKSLSHHASCKDSALGCMLCIEIFGGKELPLVMQSDPIGCKAKKLVYLLLHQENTTKLPQEVNDLVERIKSKKGVKANKGVEAKKKR